MTEIQYVIVKTHNMLSGQLQFLFHIQQVTIQLVSTPDAVPETAVQIYPGFRLAWQKL